MEFAASLATLRRSIRYRVDYLQWWAGRWDGPGVPHIVKRRVVLGYASRYGLRSFVETGTFFGDMLAAMVPHFDELVSVELSEALHRKAAARFRGVTKVRVVQGDSGRLLPVVLKGLGRPAMFWLDAHYSGGVTARGDVDSPILQELEAILIDRTDGHVLLMDDARMFNGSGGYPTLDELCAVVAERRPGYCVEAAQDIIRIVPRSTPS